MDGFVKTSSQAAHARRRPPRGFYGRASATSRTAIRLLRATVRREQRHGTLPSSARAPLRRRLQEAGARDGGATIGWAASARCSRAKRTRSASTRVRKSGASRSSASTSSWRQREEDGGEWPIPPRDLGRPDRVVGVTGGSSPKAGPSRRAPHSWGTGPQDVVLTQHQQSHDVKNCSAGRQPPTSARPAKPDLDDHGPGLALLRLPGRGAAEGEPVTVTRREALSWPRRRRRAAAAGRHRRRLDRRARGARGRRPLLHARRRWRCATSWSDDHPQTRIPGRAGRGGGRLHRRPPRPIRSAIPPLAKTASAGRRAWPPSRSRGRSRARASGRPRSRSGRACSTEGRPSWEEIPRRSGGAPQPAVEKPETLGQRFFVS